MQPRRAGRFREAGLPAVQVLSAALTIPILLFDALITANSIQNLHANDYGKFYYAMQAWQSGGSLYAPNPATHMRIGDRWYEYLNMNPPHFHLLVWPFASLPLEVSAYLWLTINVVCAGAAIVLVCRELKIPLRSRWFWPIAAYVLLCAPTATVLVTGQFSGLLLLAMATAWTAERRGEQWTAGIWIGVLASLKPFLGLFLPVLLLRREWRTAAAACVAGLACLLLGVLTFGLDSHREWLTAISNVQWAWSSMNGSIAAVLARAFTPSPYYTAVFLSASLVSPLWTLGAAAVLAVTLVSARRSTDHMFATVVLGALLVSPLGWIYYLWLAVPGCLALWRERVPIGVWFALGALLIPYFAPIKLGTSPLSTITIGSPYTWATLYLWWAAARTPITSANQAGVTPIERLG